MVRSPPPGPSLLAGQLPRYIATGVFVAVTPETSTLALSLNVRRLPQTFAYAQSPDVVILPARTKGPQDFVHPPVILPYPSVVVVVHTEDFPLQFCTETGFPPLLLEGSFVFHVLH